MKWVVPLIVFSTLFTSAAQLSLKYGAERLPQLLTNFPLLLGFVLYCLAALMIIVGLKYADLSIVFPALATNFLWVSLISIFILGETLSAINWAGIGFIVAGVSLLGRNNT